MSREEFLDAWEQMPGLKFAELVEGVVYMPSPLPYEHGHYDGAISLLLNTYATRTDTCGVLSSTAWLMLDSAPQTDLALRLFPEHGGQLIVGAQFISGAPELAVEVSHSSRSYDLGPKLAL